MELIKNVWTKEDGDEFIKYLRTFEKAERVEWTKNLLKTDYDVLAVPAPKLKMMAKEIAKGNFISFLDLKLDAYYENTAINALLIDKIKDFNTYADYLRRYAEIADNWATCDVLPFKNTKRDKEKLFELSHEFIKSPKPFMRRIGVDMLFTYTEDASYNERVRDLIKTLKSDGEYYVNMCVAWLVAEYVVKQRDYGIYMLASGILNDFTINKAISKCRDSYRVSQDDKEFLLKYKV